MTSRADSALRRIRSLATFLLFLQLGMLLIGFHAIYDIFTEPYESEWLTPYAFLPHTLLYVFAISLCMLLTWRLRDRTGHPWAWLWLSLLGVPTVLITAGMIYRLHCSP